MLTLLIIFLSICLVGAGFWFFNKKQINGLVENIDDKQAIINALQSHVESVAQPQPHQTIEETVVIGETENKKRNGGNKNKKKKNNVPTPFNPAKSEIVVDLRQEKKNRPKPRRKPKTQQ